MSVSRLCHTVSNARRGSTLKTVNIARVGDRSVADHLHEMRAWLDAQGIEARELTVLHVLQFRMVFRAVFDKDADADQFAAQFG